MKLTVKEFTKAYNDVLVFCKEPKTVKQVAQEFNLTMNCANLRLINFYCTGLVRKHERKFKWTGDKYQYQNRIYKKRMGY